MVVRTIAIRVGKPLGERVPVARLADVLSGSRGSRPKSCKDFASQAEAQAYFEAHGGNAQNNVDNLDHNHNGIACEVYPYGRTGGRGVARLRPVAGRLLLPGLAGALGWAAGRRRA